MERAASDLSTNSFWIDTHLANEIRDKLTRSLIRLSSGDRVEQSALQPIVFRAMWAEREDLRSYAGDYLDFVLAYELTRINSLLSDSEKFDRQRLISWNESFFNQLPISDVDAASRADPAEAREARIRLSVHLHSLLPYLGPADPKKEVRLLAIAASDSKAEEALFRIVAPWAYSVVLEQLIEDEAYRRGRVWVLTRLWQGSSSSQSDARPELLGSIASGLMNDPFVCNAALRRKDNESGTLVYSRGADGADDGGDPDTDLLLYELPAR